MNCGWGLLAPYFWFILERRVREIWQRWSLGCRDDNWGGGNKNQKWTNNCEKVVEKSMRSWARGDKSKPKIKSIGWKISGIGSLSTGKKIKGRREGKKWLVVDHLSESRINRAFSSGRKARIIPCPVHICSCGLCYLCSWLLGFKPLIIPYVFPLLSLMKEIVLTNNALLSFVLAL